MSFPPRKESVDDFNAIDDKYSYVITSSKPDRHYEYFWLTFKDSISKCVSVEIKKEILKLSPELDALQKEEKYDIIKAKISDFFIRYIDDIMTSVIISQNTTRICHLRKNIIRWKEIDNDVEYDLPLYNFLVAVKTGLDKKKGDRVLDAIKLFVKFLVTTSGDRDTEFKNLVEFTNHCIDNTLLAFLNVAIHYIDVTLFLKAGCKKDKEKIMSMDGVKVIRYLEAKPNLTFEDVKSHFAY